MEPVCVAVCLGAMKRRYQSRTRGRRLVACLAVLLAGGLIHAQLAALTPAHEHHSASDQCAICHAGHMHTVAPPVVVRPEPPAIMTAAIASEPARAVPSRQPSRQSSRAPPTAPLL